MKTILSLSLLFSSLNVLALDLLERQMDQRMVKNQRKYSSMVIYEMIKSAKKNENECNIDIGFDNPSFYIDKGEHSFFYTNKVYSSKDMYDSNHYQCLLDPDKKKLECNERLPRESNSIFQQSDIYVRLTINLDEVGNAVSMYGVKSRKYNIAGHTLPDLLEKTITEFTCDIQPPPVVKDTAVSDKKRADDKSFNIPKNQEIKGASSVTK